MSSGGRAADVAHALASAFLAGEWTREGLLASADAALERRPRRLRHVVRQVLRFHPRPPADRPRELAALIVVELHPVRRPLPRVVRIPPFEAAMGRVRWPVPELPTAGDLAAWLGLDAGELAWLADARGLERRVADERLRNYRYTWVERRAGGPPRLIERPKARLKAVQRRVLDEVLVAVPPHDAAHGFVRGRSALTHAAAHTGAEVVLRFDLEDFFASVEAGRVYGILRTAGYPESVAHALTALLTNAAPPAVAAVAPYRLRRRLATPHLPQGAPTSPAVANLCAFRLDRRLAGYAAALGARYTRYADDLVLSGGAGLRRRAGAIEATVARIATDEGFRLNARKSRAMPAAGRQEVCGIVVNARPNVPRAEYDALRAILHNAARNGPEAENRAGVPDFRAHLLGRISWVAALNPARGERLRERFAAIDWDA